MNISVTRLSAHDVNVLQELNQVFSDAFEDSENYSARNLSAEYLSGFLENRDHIVLVATNNDAVVGGLVAYCLTKFEQERKEVYVYDLAVAKNVQRQGIGKLLMDEVKHLAKALGAYVVFVQADEVDDAVRFYESLEPSENIKTRNFDFEL